MNTYLLVDGGGSKTSIRLIEAKTGKYLFESQGGPGSLVAGAICVWATINDLLSSCPIRPDEFVCGLAGSECENERREFLSQAQMRTLVVSDCDSGLFGAHQGQPGCCLTVGTGVALSWIDQDQIVYRRGGLGFILGDEGGGAWLGLQAIRSLAVTAQTDKLTLDQFCMLSKFQIGYNLADWIHFANQATPREFAKLARPLVEERLENLWAQSILDRGCGHLLSVLAAVPPELRISLLGGLSPVYRELLYNRGIHTSDAKGDALDGLAFIAQYQDVIKIEKWISHE